MVLKGDGCWEWSGCRTNGGYGRFGRSRRLGWILAHRMSWILAHGEIPPDMCVCHKCDNRICVKPDHLFLGTKQDNIKDCITKGRRSRHANPYRDSKGRFTWAK